MGKLSVQAVLLLCLIFYLYEAKKLPVVGILPNKTIQVQIGQHYSYEIPQYFQTYQHAKIVNFTHQQTKFKGKVCSISVLKQSNYQSKDIIFHFELSTPSPQYFGDKVIYQFDDLIKINQVMDSVMFKEKIFVLFQTKHYVIYSIKDNGSIVVSQSPQTIVSQYAGLSYGNMVQDTENLLFFSQTEVFYFNQLTNKFQPVSGYDLIGPQFQYATMYNNTIYAAAGQKGILVYQWDMFNKKIYKKLQFNLTEGQQNSKFNLSPVDIQFDNINSLVYIIDSEQGIKWFKVPTDDKITQVACEPSNILIQNCENLHLTGQFLFATCPNVLKVSLSDKSNIQVGPTVSFYPNQIIINDARVILLGDNRYAIWDTQGGSIQAGSDVHLISMAFFKNQWIVIINQFDISVGQISPSSEQMYCEMDKTDQIIGTNQFNLTFQGICSQLVSQNTSNLLNRVQTGNCLLQQPIKLIVKDSSIFNFLIQLILIGVLVWCGSVAGIYYCVKDFRVRKGYHNLPQERTGLDQGKTEEVMSSKSQQVQNK